MEELNGLHWFKSSYSGNSGGGGGGCVEAADLGSHRAMRDSTDPHGLKFVFPSTSWTAFITAVKRGEFDLTDR